MPDPQLVWPLIEAPEVGRFETLLRGSLWIDAALIDMLEVKLPHPEELRLDRMSFPAKVDLVMALGVLGGDARRRLLTLNKLRNRMAHEPGHGPTDEEIEELVQAMGGDVVAEHELDPGRYPDRPLASLKVILLSLAMMFDHVVRLARYEAEHAEIRLAARVRQAFDKSLAGLPPHEVIGSIPPPPQPGDGWLPITNAGSTDSP